MRNCVLILCLGEDEQEIVYIIGLKVQSVNVSVEVNLQKFYEPRVVIGREIVN